MLISHEVPVALLEKSKQFNDYDYALVHLFEQIPEYKEFYYNSLKEGRTVYLDNSIFELGVAFDSEKFAKICKEMYNINKDNFYYIIPDALEDKDKTIKNYEDFSFKDGNKICVVQGKTLYECVECFDYFKGKCEVIGISFDYSWYLNDTYLQKLYELLRKNITDYDKYMLGRITFLSFLKHTGRLNGVKIHLLGCYLPQEFSFYRDSDFSEIKSTDTSNPIVHGIKNIKYTDDGLKSKESIKLIDLINVDVIPDTVYFNIAKFNQFVNKESITIAKKEDIDLYVDKHVDEDILKTFKTYNKLTELYQLKINKEIVGFIGGRNYDDHGCDFKVCYCHVRKDYRGKKLGRKLLDFIKTKHKNILYVTSENLDGDKLFKNKEPFLIKDNEFGFKDKYFTL